MIDLKKILFIRLLFNIYQISKIRKKNIILRGFLLFLPLRIKYQLPDAYVQSLKCLEAWDIFLKDLRNVLIVDFLRVRHRHVHPWVKHYSHAFWNSRTNQFLSGINILFPKLRCFLGKLYSYNFYIYKSHVLTKNII